MLSGVCSTQSKHLVHIVEYVKMTDLRLFWFMKSFCFTSAHDDKTLKCFYNVNVFVKSNFFSSAMFFFKNFSKSSIIITKILQRRCSYGFVAYHKPKAAAFPKNASIYGNFADEFGRAGGICKRSGC